eukprot:scaffold6326_cov327-Prasinococcus_capsulatus_cf.AAC.6
MHLQPLATHACMHTRNSRRGASVHGATRRGTARCDAPVPAQEGVARGVGARDAGGGALPALARAPRQLVPPHAPPHHLRQPVPRAQR